IGTKVAANQRAVNVSAEIFIFAEMACAVTRHGHKSHERPVTQQQNQGDTSHGAQIGAYLIVRTGLACDRCQVEPSGREIAQRYTLQHPRDTDGTEIEERYAIQEKSDRKDQRAAAK